MNLDFRTVLVMSTLLNVTFMLYLFMVWVNHKKDFKGILLFVLSMAVYTLGYAGLGLRDIISPFMSIVVANTLLLTGLVLVHVSLRRFFLLKTGNILKIILILVPLSGLIEQYIFGLIIPELTVRIVSFAILDSIPLGLTSIMLIKLRKRISLPGVLLIFTFTVLFVLILIRIPVALAVPLTGGLLDAGAFYSVSSLLATLLTAAWPIGLTLLIAFQLHQREEMRSREKTILLQELYHRTKNNMQVINSLLVLQGAKYPGKEMQKLVEDMGSRIQAMSLVHEMLYQSEDLSHISLKSYIEKLAASILEDSNVSSEKVSVEIEVDDMELLIDTAVPLGLVLNELITNSLKHAFPEEQRGKITIGISRRQSRGIEIVFSDNGTGISEEVDFENRETLGLKMIRGLIEQQMHGTVRFERKDGLTCYMEISDTLYEKRI